MAKRFTDSAGSEWVIMFNVATLNRVKDIADVDLGFIPSSQLKAMAAFEELTGKDQLETSEVLDVFATFGETLLGELSINPRMLSHVIYAIVKPQADDRKIPDYDAFSERLDPGTLQKAADAFWPEYSDFFLETKQTLFHESVQMAMTLREAIGGKIVGEEEEPSKQQSEKSHKSLETSISGSSSSMQQASSESILAPTR